MPRKTPSTTPAVRPGDGDLDALAMEGHLATLDRQEARQRDQDAADIEQLRQAWAPALSQAQMILAELVALETAYAPTLQSLEGQDFSSLLPSAQNLNAIAAIERACRELRHNIGHTIEDLRRIIAAVEGLSPRTIALLLANGPIYKELLAMYRHTPPGVRELFQRLEHLVASLTEGMESATNEEVYTPVRRLPPAPPLTPEVEMMA